MNNYLFVQQISANQQLLLDPQTKALCRRKYLSIYDESVYRYLLIHHHPNIVSILDISHEGEKLAVVEKEIEGETLHTYLENHVLEDEEKEIIFDEILDGVEFLHHANPPIIHRDLKPDNIMITTHNVVKIIDFNAAKTYIPNKAHDTVLIGTAGTAAPEQYGFQESDKRTDIYALGILAKEMFSDKKVFIKKATALDPKDRYQNIREMRKTFHTAIPPYSWQPFTLKKPGTVYRFLFFQALFLWLASMIETGSSVTEILINRICVFAIFECVYMLYAKWTPLFKLTDVFNNQKRWIRITVNLFISFGIVFIWAFIATIFG